MIRRAAVCKHFGAAKILRWGGFIPHQQESDRGPRAAPLRGVQVRIPISELKAYLTEKLAY